MPLKIHIPDCDGGWLPTQHIHLRILVGARIFESHAFTITNAPHSAHTGGRAVLGLDGAEPRGITLYAKVTGDWTRAVNALAREPGYRLAIEGKDEEVEDALAEDEDQGLMQQPETVSNVKVLLSGPYGGLKLDMAQYQSVLLVAGGSGVTFMLGCIEECLVRKADLLRRGRGQDGPRKVECVWVVRDMCRFAVVHWVAAWLIWVDISDDRKHVGNARVPTHPRILRQRLPAHLPPLPHEPTTPTTPRPADIPPAHDDPLPLPTLYLPNRARIAPAANPTGTRGRTRDAHVL